MAGEADLRAHQSDAGKMETQVSRDLRGGPGSHLGFDGGGWIFPALGWQGRRELPGLGRGRAGANPRANPHPPSPLPTLSQPHPLLTESL